MIKRGIDLSAWQGEVNWDVAKPNIDFAYVRVGGYDTKRRVLFTDLQAKRNLQETNRLGIPNGIYFYYGSRADPLEQARFLLDQIREMPKFTLPVAIDIEDKTIVPYDLVPRLKRFFTEIENYIIDLYIYIGPDSTKVLLKNDIFFRKYKLWLANYQINYPNVPYPWFPGEQVIWQYTDKGNGKDFGINPKISKNVDLNVGYF